MIFQLPIAKNLYWVGFHTNVIALAAIVCLVNCVAYDRCGAQEPSAISSKRNIIIFVADGLRQSSVNEKDTPGFWAVRSRGVYFGNSHAEYPTVTIPNAIAIATGLTAGDSGAYGNTIFTNFTIFNPRLSGDTQRVDQAVPSLFNGNFGKNPTTSVPFLEDDHVLGDIADRLGSAEPILTLLEAARQKGFSTASIGKLGPAAAQDLAALRPVNRLFQTPKSIIIDDSTGTVGGLPLSDEVSEAIDKAGLPAITPPRWSDAGDATRPGTLQVNEIQQRYYVDLIRQVLFPLFKRKRVPFILIYWSRDPDVTQHIQGDSFNSLRPGINGPTSQRAVANADSNLRSLMEYIDGDPELRGQTDIFVTSDHGFATVSKREIDAELDATKSFSTQFAYGTSKLSMDVLPGTLPPGFLAIDIANALGLPLFDPNSCMPVSDGMRCDQVDPKAPLAYHRRQRPVVGNGLIGGSGLLADTRTDAEIIVAANGGSDLIYIPSRNSERVRQIVQFLTEQDYVGGVFVDSSFGSVPGALPLSTIGYEGRSSLPRPAIVVSFKTFSLDSHEMLNSAVQVADTIFHEGQGSHGSLARDNTANFMAAVGPDFKSGFSDFAPVGNADIPVTIASILKLQIGERIGFKRRVAGRIVTEAFPSGVSKMWKSESKSSERAPNGRVTVLNTQVTDGRVYLDSACLLEAPSAPGGADQTCP